MTYLQKAKADPANVLVFEGDWGGQVYAVCRVELIECTEDSLLQLLRDLDAVQWQCNDGEGAGIYIQKAEDGEGIFGGMGGGVVDGDLWVHDRLRFFDLEEKIKEVLAGKHKRIVETDEELSVLYERLDDAHMERWRAELDAED
jgi:hypothetical protein